MAQLVLHKGHDPSICDTGGLCVLTWFQLGSVWGSHLLHPSPFALMCTRRDCSLEQLHLSPGVEGWDGMVTQCTAKQGRWWIE